MGFVLQELRRYAAHRLEQAGDFGLLQALVVVIAALVAFPRTRFALRVVAGMVAVAIIAWRDRKRERS